MDSAFKIVGYLTAFRKAWHTITQIKHQRIKLQEIIYHLHVSQGWINEF